MESHNNDWGKTLRNIGLIIGIPVLIAVIFWMFMAGGQSKTEEKIYSDYINYFKNEQVESYDLNLGGRVNILLKPEHRTDVNGDGKVNEKDIIVYAVPNVALFLEDIDPYIENVPHNMTRASQVTSWVSTMIPSLLTIIIFVALFIYMRRSMNNLDGGGKMMGFGKAHVKQPNDESRRTTFADVAGADEEKEELQEIVEFLRSPKRFKELGARVPKGVLLVGPPGTGKTLLARAVAGEAGVHFFSISGSDFVEMYVGVGASRVRDLFDQAKKNNPCIIFIDEIDAVGRQRGAGLGGGHDEREQTLNQLLVEMDGFGANEGVIMMAATNRPDILDPALMRPGRFDRQIVVNYPDVKGREEILRVHAKGKPLAPDVNLAVIARSTVGFTGADLENLLNESALLAARRGLHAVTMQEIEEATLKIIVGTEKRSHIITDRDKRITAYHEAGHAIVSYFCPTHDPVHQISVIPRGMAAGFTMNLPDNDNRHLTKNRMLEDIEVMLGGRVAEEIVIGDVTTGASNDLERSTETATKMVTKYGMSEKLGPVVFGSSESGEVFLGRDFGHTRNYSEEIAARIDAEINAIITAAYARATQKLQENRDKLDLVAQYLIDHEKMDGDQFVAAMEGREIPAYSNDSLFQKNEDTAE
ncbi:MAG: ATP-dependent zinc metalloprotease FtsH [Clostridia bacterium]|nr:ATP-dependent zinc metalloprotease FtsH [Clostridia bacterium]